MITTIATPRLNLNTDGPIDKLATITLVQHCDCEENTYHSSCDHCPADIEAYIEISPFPGCCGALVLHEPGAFDDIEQQYVNGLFDTIVKEFKSSKYGLLTAITASY